MSPPKEVEKAEQPVGRERRVIAAGTLTEAEVAAIAEAKVPEEYAYLDAELEEPITETRR
jgi:hypothetical protein